MCRTLPHVFLLGLFASCTFAADWPTYQGNPAHTGYVPESLDTSKFSLKWQITAGTGSALNPIAVGGGKVVVSSPSYFATSGLYVYSADTGAPIWHVNYSQLFSTNPPAYANGIVYIQTGASTDPHIPYLRAYNAATGQLAFQAAFDAQWESYLAPTIVDDTVYVNGGYYGGMYSFSALNGTRNWFHGLAQYDQWTPAVDSSYAYAYLGGTLTALKRDTGDVAFTIPDMANYSGSFQAPVLGGTNDVIVIANPRLVRFDLASQNVAWQLSRSFTGQPSVAHGVIYALDGGTLEAWGEASGALLWSWAPSSDSLSGPMIVTDTHVIISGTSKVYAVNLGTHLSDWSYAAAGTLALANHALYIAQTNGNKLTAIRVAPPRPYDDSTTAYLSTPLNIDVLANDDGFVSPVTVTVSTAPLHGTAVVNGSPGTISGVNVTYTPDDDYLGPDSFQYTADDGSLSGTAVVSINVISPQTNADVAVTHLSTPISIDVMKNDAGYIDPVTVDVTTTPAHGTAVVTGSPGNAASLRVTYTPTAGFTGTDSLQYQVSDGIKSGSANVSITVLNFKAFDDSYVVLRGNYCCSGNTLSVLANDLGFSNPVSVTIAAQPNKSGSAYIYGSPGPKAGIYISYSPNTNVNVGDFTENFTYQVTDGTNADTGKVSVKVVSFIAQNDSAKTNIGDPVTIPVGTNDLGFGSPATIGLFSGALHGSTTINGSPGYPSNMSITYSPDSGFKGTDTFQYAMDDGPQVGIATVTVSVLKDADHDGVDDSVDNCLGVSNPDQRDSDGDGYGNACDADLNNDGRVNFADLAIFRSRFATKDPDADLNGDGVVNFADLAKFRTLFGNPPGPSALHPNCPPTCP
jgi:hypothetical protein